MRLVNESSELIGAVQTARSEAQGAFGDSAVYLERSVSPARHIEVQILGDGAGRALALGERECSVQRRHQKLVEEAPAQGLSDEVRAAMGDAALAVAEGLEAHAESIRVRRQHG